MSDQEEIKDAMEMIGKGYNVVKNKSNDHKYFIITPRIVKVYSRNPYDLALWDTVKDVAGDSGECYLNTDQLAALSGMSAGKASDSRKYWIELGFLEGEIRRDQGYQQPVWHITVPDLWLKNIEWCEKYPKIDDRIAFMKSLHSVKPSLSEGGVSPRETKKNQQEEPKYGVPPNYSIEWQVASGADKLHATDENHAKRVDFSNLVSQYTPNPPMAFAIAMAFQEQRGVTLPESKVKAQRKAIKEMLEMGVTGDHVRRATRQLMEKKMTVIDLFSVSKTAQDIANKPAEIVEYTRIL